jgi:hypothetical protein
MFKQLRIETDCMYIRKRVAKPEGQAILLKSLKNLASFC